MKDFLTLAGITKYFSPQLSLGDRIAARLGGDVEVRHVHAVEDVTLSIAKGETLGLVGESGCGKSTLGRIAAGILPPTRGQASLDTQPVRAEGRKTVTRIQTVFQDPYASLNPRMQIGKIIAEGPVVHGLVEKNKADAYVAEWLDRVGLDGSYTDRYPHQFSGGQRQRIAIARALAMQPDVLICDEPVASLDVSIQAQIINLFLKLRQELSITCLFISHDLSVVRHISDRIAIMYLGRIVELGETQTVYQKPRHPYTQALLDSVPKLVLREDMLVELKAIEGELPSPLDPPRGCRFNPRCPVATERCRSEMPELRLIDDESREVSCHLV